MNDYFAFAVRSVWLSAVLKHHTAQPSIQTGEKPHRFLCASTSQTDSLLSTSFLSAMYSQSWRNGGVWSVLFGSLNLCHMASAKGHGKKHLLWLPHARAVDRQIRWQTKQTLSLSTGRKMTHTQRRRRVQTDSHARATPHMPPLSENPAANK